MPASEVWQGEDAHANPRVSLKELTGSTVHFVPAIKQALYDRAFTRRTLIASPASRAQSPIGWIYQYLSRLTAYTIVKLGWDAEN